MELTRITYALRLAKDCSYADVITEDVKDILRNKIDDALTDLSLVKKLYTREDLAKAIEYGVDLESGDLEHRNFEKYIKVVDQFIAEVLTTGNPNNQ